MKYFVIADNKCVDLFQTIGVDGICILDDADARTAVQEALKRDDIGTLLVSKSVYRASSDVIKTHQETGLFPAVVTLDRE